MTSVRRIFLFILPLSLVFSACVPLRSIVATAVAQTLTALPAATPTPAILPTPSSDDHVIDVDPHDMLMTLEDLSSEPKYFPPDFDSIRQNKNEDVLKSRGMTEGQDYIDRTGRVDGWIATFARGDNTVNAPELIEDTVVLYYTSAGASLVRSASLSTPPTQLRTRAVTTITTQNTMFLTAEFTCFLLPWEKPAASLRPRPHHSLYALNPLQGMASAELGDMRQIVELPLVA